MCIYVDILWMWMWISIQFHLLQWYWNYQKKFDYMVSSCLQIFIWASSMMKINFCTVYTVDCRYMEYFKQFLIIIHFDYFVFLTSMCWSFNLMIFLQNSKFSIYISYHLRFDEFQVSISIEISRKLLFATQIVDWNAWNLINREQQW